MLLKVLKIFIFIQSICYAQRFADQVPQIKRYEQKDIYDSIAGIAIFNRLIEPLGGDSIKYNLSGYNLQGWWEEHYANGNVLHKGYYIDGRLKVFKNYFENGKVERSFINPDPLHCTLDVFYENGMLKRKTSYYDQKPQKYYEYYSNGLPKLILENEKEMKFITLKKEWYDNGQVESTFELKDKKEMIFAQRSYYITGQVKEEGNMKLTADGKSYVKDGQWIFYEESGKSKKIEKFKVQ